MAIEIVDNILGESNGFVSVVLLLPDDDVVGSGDVVSSTWLIIPSAHIAQYSFFPASRSSGENHGRSLETLSASFAIPKSVSRRCTAVSRVLVFCMYDVGKGTLPLKLRFRGMFADTACGMWNMPLLNWSAASTRISLTLAVETSSACGVVAEELIPETACGTI